MKKLCVGLLCVLLLGLCACGRQAAPEGGAPELTTSQETTAYFGMVWGWQCPEGKYAAYIDKIYHTQRGTAGSTGKAALAAVALLDFSKAYAQDDRAALGAVFASMNDAQARHFASQWISLFSTARSALLDPARFREEYGWAGLEDFDAALYSAEELDHLFKAILSFYLEV